jgi:hypothetical protein
VGEHFEMIGERYLEGGARVVHIVLWPRWRTISRTNFPNLLI